MRSSYFRQGVAANLGCLTVFLAGCWISWASVALKKLSDTEPDTEHIGFRLSKYEISWMACLLDLGNALSPILAFLVIDRIGRKKTLLLSFAIFCLPILFLIYPNVQVLYLVRFSVGFAKGIAFVALPLYISEISESSIRGTLGSFSASQMFFSILLVLVVGPFISLKVLDIGLCVLPFIFMILFAFMPESPYFLASVEKYDEFKESLKWYRSTDDVQEEYDTIIKKSKEDMKESSGFTQLFAKASSRRALFIVLGTSGLQRLGGITSLIVFGPKTFPKTDIQFIGPAQSSIILMVTTMIGSVSQVRLNDTIGRRKMLAFSSLMDCIMLFLIGLYFIFPSLEYSYVCYLLLVGYGFCYYGVGSIPHIFVGELFPMNTRSQAATVSAVFMAIGSFLTNKFHFILVSFNETFLVFWIYAFFNLVIFYFAIKFVFETKCKSFTEIQDILNSFNSSREILVPIEPRQRT